MAGPYDLSGTMMNRMLDGQYYAEPFYLPFMMKAYIHYYELGEVGDYFLPEFVFDIPELFSGNYGAGHINNYMNDQNYNPPILSVIPTVVEEFTDNENYFFRQLLRENDLYDWTPQSLTFLFHGISDHLVPYENSVVAYDKFIENGAENVFIELLDESYGDHQEAAPYAILGAYGIIESMKNINPIGDVNHDQFLNVMDVLSCVNMILGQIENLDEYTIWAGDLDSNNFINVIDVLNLVQIILSE